MIIDGTDLILGRVASVAAKKALLGENVTIVNCEKIVISGPRTFLYGQIRRRSAMGGPYKGPFFQSMPDRFVRRAIRGMLPYKQERGKKAFARIMCYLGVPEKYKNEKRETIPDAAASKLRTLNFLHVQDIARFMGKKI